MREIVPGDIGLVPREIERGRFEEWTRCTGWVLFLRRDGGTGIYCDNKTQIAWTAWRAAMGLI